jgi:lipopolysaccharide export system permease protein
MKVLQRYFFTEVLQSVLLVLVAFLAIFSFFELIEEMAGVGKNGYQLQHAFLFIVMGMPGRIYEMMPLAALVGTIYALSQFAARSEFTIMRAASLSTQHAGWMLAKIGVLFVAISILFGEVVAPWSAQAADRLKLGVQGAAVSQGFRSGMWTKDNIKANGVTGRVIGSRFFNLHAMRADGQLQDVRLYEFDADYRLQTMLTARSADYRGNNTWRLGGVTETRFLNRLDPRAGATTASAAGLALPPGAPFAMPGDALVVTRQLATRDIVSEITPKILSVSAANPKRMSAYELAVYSRHLAENRQDSERYEIEFWKKIIDPFAVFVMMALALPFAYLHVRSGGVSLKIFIGVMIGVSFVLVNSLFSHLGLLNTWPPLVTAALPSVLYTLLAIGALRWVERH